MRLRSYLPLAFLALSIGVSAPAWAEEAPTDYDAVMVGGGPAGAMTALKLSQQGYRVLVVEKRGAERQRAQIVGLKSLTDRELAEVGAAPGPSHVAQYVKPHDVRAAALPEAVTNDPVKQMIDSYSTHTMTIADLEHSLHVAIGAHKNIDLRFDTSLEGAPTLGADEAVHLSIKDASGASKQVRAKFLVVADGAGSPTLKSLGVGAKSYVTGKVAAAFFDQKGNNALDYDTGIARVADIDSTYTLNALSPKQAKIEGAELETLLRTNADKVGIDHDAKITKSWTFDATMQHANKFLMMKDHVLVIGDAASTPHPLTGMGVNKALYEAELTADSVGKMLSTSDPTARHRQALSWKASMYKSMTSLHRATLPLFRQFGSAVKTPRYLRVKQSPSTHALVNARRL